jgi:predicted GTPase
MQIFTNELMQYSQKFFQSFKTNSQKIIEGYNIKENNSIEHINFIVLGKAGVGKSSFINESLLLSENKKAIEGRGKSVTDRSILYSSEKLKMIRMWDTQGLDYKITQEYILNEVKRLVEEGLKQGPDHYINIILYCTTGDRFQDEDGQLIYEIMKLYPSDNLPVIITQLKAYFKNKSKEMEKIIREILENYLDHQIVKKIEIKSIVSRDFRDENIYCKAEGIPELLRLSFDVMGRAISSATCKKLSQDIEQLCKCFVDEKIDYIQKIFKYEMEILDFSKNLFVEDLEDEEDYFNTNTKEKKKKELSELNMYRKIQKEDYFIENFVTIMKNKFLLIFNHLNNENIQTDDTDNLKEEQEKNEGNKEEKMKEEKKEEKIEEETKKDANQQENKENKEKKENNEKEEDENENVQKEDKPLVLFFIEDRLKNMEKKINEASNKAFEKIFKIKYQIYLSDLQREQSVKNKEFNDNSQIIDVIEVEKNFREKLFTFFKNEFYKIFFCIILKLFMTNLKNILILNYKKELKENEII